MLSGLFVQVAHADEIRHTTALRQSLCGAGVRFGRKPRLTLRQQQEGGGTNRQALHFEI